MAKFTIKIEAILGGQADFQNYAAPSQFGSSLAIDPDLPATSGGTKASGFLVPVPSTKVSSTTITNPPMWMIPNPKLTVAYIYDNGGKVYSMTGVGVVVAAFGGTALTASAGNGMAYYDNYYYFAKNADIARHGPLNGSRSMNQTYWTSTLSMTALDVGSITYPVAVRPAIAYPNHPMHVHKHDNKLYIGDVVKNQGVVHYIKTRKVTVEGDTNDGSTYNALDLPYGCYPTDIESLGQDLIIAAFEGNIGGAFTGGKASLFVWDTFAPSWTRRIELPDEYVSALLNVNGTIYIFSGNVGVSGVRITRLIGGYVLDQIGFLQDSCPPFPGALEHAINRILFGGYADHLGDYACVWAIGSKIKGHERSLFNIMRFTGTAGTPAGATSLLRQDGQALIAPKQFLGWSDGTNMGVDLPNTTYGVSTYRSEMYRIGMPFKITKIRIPLAQAVGANMTLIPTIYVDDESSNTALTTINNTNYPNSERNIRYLQPEIYGKHNFMLELAWSGSSLLSLELPIEIEIETIDE